jgi:2-polyprenyl-3-methyl-5-hydroxy-6-metoxy-1,4-benzoquinol methylase
MKQIMRAGAYSRQPVAVHPGGFRVFLSPEEIDRRDEYRESDPHTFDARRDSAFHRWRIACTLGMVGKAVNELGAAAKVLDVGCGQGHITARIKHAHPDAEVLALDHSVAAIEYATDHFPGIDFAVGDAFDCPYQHNYFDVVVCNNVWEHVPAPLHLLTEIKRVTRPGGFAIISTPSRYRLANLIRVLLGKQVDFASKHHVTEYSVGQVLEHLEYGGFDAVSVSSQPVVKTSLKSKLASVIFSRAISITGSHHQLGETAFYLCRSR